MRKFLARFRVAAVTIPGIVIGALVAFGLNASAVTSAGPVPHAAYACVNLSTHTAFQVLDSPSRACPAGTTSIVLGAQGKTGPAGTNGATGPAGPAGPTGASGAQGIPGPTGANGTNGTNGIMSVNAHDLGAKASVVTGGSFVTNATEVGTIDLGAGTWLLQLSAKATPTMTSAVQVFPQFFVYDRARNDAFVGDLFNVGSGALESGGNTQIDSYYSGDGVITLATSTVLHVYAFGYDSDRGPGSYALDDLNVETFQLTTG